jgi:hypothetical protein
MASLLDFAEVAEQTDIDFGTAIGLVPAPGHARDTAIAVAGNSVEEVLAEIKIGFGTTHAAINNLSLVGLAVLALDGNGLAAERVQVGVGGSVIGAVEDLLGDSDNSLIRSAGQSASTKTDIIPGQISRVLGAGCGQTAAGTGRRRASGCCRSAAGGAGSRSDIH